MNLAQALKRKNKLVAEYNAALSTATSSNSFLKGAVVKYNSRDMLAKAVELQDELIALKTSIHTASAPIRGKIFEIGELKSFVKKLAAMSVQEGAVTNYRSSGGPDVYEVTMDILERDKTVAAIQKEIESLQDEIDKFNATTSI